MTDVALARHVRRLGHLDLPGGGQVVVQGDHAYVGHMKPPHGTTIIDIAEPVAGQPAPQSNDVTLDDRGLICLVDRLEGFDILELQG